MKASETILFSDLDGTLFASDGTISPENREAIAQYIAEGGLFAVSTGRLPENALVYLKDLPINGPSVVVNGGAIYDFATRSYSLPHYLDRTITDPVFKHCIEAYPNTDMQICTPEGIVYLTPEGTAQPLLLSLHRPCRFLDWSEVENLPFFKALIYAPKPQSIAMGEELRALSKDRFGFMECSTDIGGRMVYYEVMPLGINKGMALNGLRNDPRTKGRTFFAVGDYWNDYELLSCADVGIAPSNALPEIKAIADRVTVSNNESAIAHIIREIIAEA